VAQVWCIQEEQAGAGQAWDVQQLGHGTLDSGFISTQTKFKSIRMPGALRTYAIIIHHWAVRYLHAKNSVLKRGSFLAAAASARHYVRH
jgi:hypothetical protein